MHEVAGILVPMKSVKSRRTAEETREAMLDAAVRRLDEAGPGGLRLQDIAEEVGVSHPAVLYHFGSREGLVQAVIQRSVLALQEDLLAAFEDVRASPPDGSDLFERVFETLTRGGHARLVAWLLLSGYDPLGSPAVSEKFRRIIDATYAARTGGGSKLLNKSLYEDTQFSVVLSALALLGQAIAGPAVFATAGLSSSATHQKRFRAWIARLLTEHLVEE